MNEKLMSDIGENYEYIRTIVNNKIEIFKIDLAQNAAKTLGFLMLSLVMIGMFFIFLAILIAALTLLLAELLGSMILGLLCAGLVLLILCIALFALRKPLIFKPVAKLFYSKIADKF